MIGKNGVFTLICSLALATVSQVAIAQSGPLNQRWGAKDKPGDGVVEVVLPDGATPMGCRMEISLKGGSNCSKVFCRGDQTAITQSPQSMMAAKRIALSVAKAHYVHFLTEEINSQRTTNIISEAIKLEGGPSAKTEASDGYSNVQDIREQASALIKGFAVVEDGFEKIGDGYNAYVIGGVSCLSQQAADNLNAGNQRDNATFPGANAPAGQGNNSVTPMRRRAGADQM